MNGQLNPEQIEAADGGLAEVLAILRVMTPLAAAVWAFAFVWATTEAVWPTIGFATLSAGLAAFTVFADRRFVVKAWASFASFLIAVAALYFVSLACYYGLLYVFDIAKAIVMWPLRHPYLTFASLAMLCLVFGAASGETQEVEGETSDRNSSNSTGKSRRRFGPKIRSAIWNASNRRCHYCHCHLESWLGAHMHLDHLVPLARGGADEEENLVASCPSCNLEKHAAHYPELGG